ncbi:FAD/NAD(P)-binding domain-containing protein [Amniculicola lignicola CBS 123094]|uniref:FAD/NAD(P)-binding domain-containing protein n=1 Tax=Amniculicola lignicola CBS 123094 TaxID=1392246 RepID=A0A6A5W1E7_9PLEO|nr:FAD/NAD(P)-binding domain-containing protein [Amniculicola lignicola CBS 123094]
MKVLITGAGISGSALAFWLAKLGHTVTVIERFPSLRATGLQLDLRGHGIEVMKRMGLESAYRAKAIAEQGMQVVDSSGRRRAWFPVNNTGKGTQSFSTEWELLRGDMCTTLYERASREGAEYVFGTTVEKVMQEGELVHVWFKNGRTADFDLVVGADGVGSRMRKMILGSETKDGFVRLPGLYVAYFTCKLPMQEGEQNIATMYTATNKRGIMTRRNNPREVQVYIGGTVHTGRLADAKPGDVEEEKEALAELFQGAGWRCDEIVRGMRDCKDFYCERMGMVKLEHWSNGRIALTGDAAWCPTANTGMGTSSSMVGAYILAGEIATHCSPSDGGEGLEAALKGYEDRFKPFMEQVQKGVEEGSWDNMPSSKFGLGVMNILLGIVSFFRIDIVKYMLKEKVYDWELPAYKELPECKDIANM